LHRFNGAKNQRPLKKDTRHLRQPENLQKVWFPKKEGSDGNKTEEGDLIQIAL
jgi:hypothetical protein